MNPILIGIAAFAVYKIFTTSRYSSPVQEPEALKKPHDNGNEANPSSAATANAAPGPERSTAQSTTIPVEHDRRSIPGEPLFMQLKPETQNTLLRNFASDYTSPRMIDNDRVYSTCVEVSNNTGAPCGWVQSIALNGSDPIRMYAAADFMLNFVDENLQNYSSLEECREQAIELARTLM